MGGSSTRVAMKEAVTPEDFVAAESEVEKEVCECVCAVSMSVSVSVSVSVCMCLCVYCVCVRVHVNLPTCFPPFPLSPPHTRREISKESV